jgi:gamma-glutamyl:cysteine ligase YbdK (ATP-grasp superfamily)
MDSSASIEWGRDSDNPHPSELTLGVEEEYMLLDGETLDLVQHVETVLAATVGHELETRVNPELMQSVLEIATPVCRTPAEVEGELRKLRGYVTGLLDPRWRVEIEAEAVTAAG